MKRERGKNEAMLLSEYTAILEWIRDTVKVDAGGHIPRGVVTTDTANLQANFSNGDIVGVALGISIKLDTDLATGARVFTDSDGTEISTYP